MTVEHCPPSAWNRVRHRVEYAAEISKAKKEIQKQYSEGEISDDQLIDKQEGLDNLKQQLISQQTQYDTNQRMAEAAWNKTCTNFYNAQVNSGVPLNDPKVMQVWNEWVKRIGANPANEAKIQADLNWPLREAMKKTAVELEWPSSSLPKPAATAKVPAPVAAKPVPPKPGRKPDLSLVPPSIAKIPQAADDSGTSGNEFAYLDRLDGLELERAIAKMSPTQASQWRMAQG